MVERWKKNIDSANKILKNINFMEILEDIKKRDFSKYRVIKLAGKKDLYRIRIGQYRIIFKNIPNEEIRIISFDKRGDVYKSI